LYLRVLAFQEVVKKTNTGKVKIIRVIHITRATDSDSEVSCADGLDVSRDWPTVRAIRPEVLAITSK